MPFALPALPSLNQKVAAKKSFRVRELCRCVALCASVGVVAAVALPAQAQPVAATANITIPGGDLGDALNRFARAAGVTLSFTPEQVRGLRTQGVSGQHSAQSGLDQLLRGSGLQAQPSGAGFVLVAQEAAVTLAPVKVSASAGENGGLGAVDGYVAHHSASATKTGTPLLRTPQMVNVVTRDEMTAKGVTNVTQALQYTPGVVSPYGNTDLRHDWLMVRGFTPGRYLDGLRLPFGPLGYAQPRIETYGLERVEVLKGPASVMFGANAPGGLVNMVSKRPTAEPLHELLLRFGSHDHREIGFDVGGAIDEAATWQYRVTAVGLDADSRVDHVGEERVFIAPALSWQPTEETRVTLLAQYQDTDADGGGAPPALPALGTLQGGAPYGKLDRDTFIGEPDYDSFSNRQTAIGYEFEHQLNSVWQLRQNLRVTDVDTYTQRVQAAALVGSNLVRYAWAFPEESKLFNVDNQAIARFSSGRAEHTLLIGIDYLQEEGTYREHFQGTSVSPLNLATLEYTGDAVKPPLTTVIDMEREQIGIYLQDEIAIDRWSLLLAGHFDHAESTTDRTNVLTAATTRAEQDDDAFTGRAGLVYEFANGVAPYVGYSQSFAPSAGTDRSGSAFDPTEGEQYEIGVRYQPDNGKGLLTLSLYELTQQNVLTPDPINTAFREQTGEVRVQGVELEGKAELIPGLEATLSYAYTDSEVTEANANGAGVSLKGNDQPFVPQHQGSAWLAYTLSSGPLQGLTTGAGARYIGAQYGDANNLFETPSVTLFDASLSYRLGNISDALRNANVSLTANNLTDEEYVSICISATGCYYGAGRSLMATLTYGW